MGKTAALEPRKEPRQERSRLMTETILEAAARVLVRDGLPAFTTNRVAEVAGVSVGSLYQYYPNKEAILFQLHARDMEETWRMLDAVLSDATRTPRQRVELAVRAFFESEAEEVPLRTGLQRAEVYIADTPEFREIEDRVVARVHTFLREALPPGTRNLAFKARLAQTLVASLAERVTNRQVPRAEIPQWAAACSQMLCTYVGL